MKKIYIIIIFLVLLFVSFLFEMYINEINIDYLLFVPIVMCFDAMFRKKWYSKYGELHSYTLGTLILIFFIDGTNWNVLIPDVIRALVGAAATFTSIFVYWRITHKDEKTEKERHKYDEIFNDKK